MCAARRRDFKHENLEHTWVECSELNWIRTQNQFLNQDELPTWNKSLNVRNKNKLVKKSPELEQVDIDLKKRFNNYSKSMIGTYLLCSGTLNMYDKNLPNHH